MGSSISLKKSIGFMIEESVDGAPSMTVDESIRLIRASVDQLEQQILDNPDQYLTSFWNELAVMNPQLKNTQPRFLHKPDEVRKRMAYARECREEVFKVLKDDGERKAEFDRLSALYSGGKQKDDRISPQRWIENLILLPSEEPDANKRRAHNEEVILLTGYLQSRLDAAPGLAQKEKFIELRKNNYIRDEGLSEEAAQERAAKDADNAADRLLEITTEQVNKNLDRRQEMLDTVNAIISGEAKNMPGGLEAAYRKINSPGTNIMFDAVDVFANLTAYGLKKDPDEVEILKKKWEQDSFVSEHSMAMLVANPYYAICDPVELILNGVSGGIQPKRIPVLDENGQPYIVPKYKVNESGFFILDENGNPQKTGETGTYNITDNTSCGYVTQSIGGKRVQIYDVNGRPVRVLPNSVNPFRADIFDDTLGGFQQRIYDSLTDKLPRYAMRGALTLSTPFDVTAYRNGRGRSVIFFREELSLDHGISVKFRDDVPGRLMNRQIEDRYDAMKAMSTKSDRLGRSSSKYRAMKNQLKKIKRIHMSDSPSRDEIEKVKEQLQKAKEVVQSYLDGKKGIEKQNMTEYERDRLTFATEFNHFIDQRLLDAQTIGEHQITMKRTLAAEQEAAAHPNRKLSADQAGMTPMELASSVEEEGYNAPIRKAKEEERRRKQEEEARREAELCTNGEVVCKGLKEVTAQPADPKAAKSKKDALKELDDLIGAKRKAYDAATSEEERRQLGEQALSSMALKKLMDFEPRNNLGETFSGPLKEGKIEGLLTVIKNSNEFKKVLDMQDLGVEKGLQKSLEDRNADGRVASNICKGLIAVIKREQKNLQNAAAQKNHNNPELQAQKNQAQAQNDGKPKAQQAPQA